ncbi:ATP-NAD kinase [Meredithblackwellia eburnea MCA 4105]
MMLKTARTRCRIPSISSWNSRQFSSSWISSRPAYNSVQDLPQKSTVKVAAMGRFANLAPPRVGLEIEQRVGSTYGGTHSLSWQSQPHSVLFVAKRNDQQALKAAIKMLQFIEETRPELTVVLEQELYDQLPSKGSSVPLRPEDIPHLPKFIDFVIALGGDGTLLRVASFFDGSSVPPVLGVSMGSLGFLMPIQLDSFPEALDQVLESRASMLLRMRLECSITDENGKLVPSASTSDEGSRNVHAMNEVALHRGNSPHLIVIKTSVDKQVLTEVVADGLLISTPTGSTAYSLSAGGPIVHPSVQSILLTAIAPRSLSFRTVLLPSDVCVSLSLSPRSRTHAALSLDGHEVRTLLPSQSLNIAMSRFPVPCISSPLSRLPGDGVTGRKKEYDPWIQDIRRMLRFNEPFQNGNLGGGGGGGVV